MSTHKSSLWCVAKECNIVAKKRHFFLFPKEHNRWLQWIHACGRHDLEVMSPEYAHRNYRLCHLHFEEKWYKVGKCRAYLQPDAVPTIFFGRNNIPVTTASEEDVERAEKDSRQEETNSDPVPSTQFSAQSSKTILPMDTDWTMDADIAKPSTSSSTHFVTIQETPRKKKLKQRNLKLKAENRMLRERIGRLQKKVKNLESTKGTTEESKEHETLRQLGCKLLPSNFAQFLSVQIDAQIKSKHGRRYSNEFKQLALR